MRVKSGDSHRGLSGADLIERAEGVLYIPVGEKRAEAEAGGALSVWR